MIDPIPYDEIDGPVRELVRVLDEFEGIETLGSCGGHVDGEPGKMRTAEDEWWVTLTLEPADPDSDSGAPSEVAWMDLEFLVYWLGEYALRRDADVQVIPYAPPPHVNEPGKMLRFEIRGYRDSDARNGEADEVAAWIRDGMAELYVEGGDTEA